MSENNKYNSYNDDSPTNNSISKAPTRTLHIRNDSTGSISSLGSITGGASTISRWKGKEEESDNKKKYNNDDVDIDEDGNNNRRNNNHRTKNDNEPNEDRVIGKTSSGFLSSILGSISISSAGSVNSIEDEKADFHKKNQKFLKRAEKDKANQMKMLGRDVNGRYGFSDYART